MFERLKGTANTILFIIATLSSLQGLITFGALYMSQPILFDLNVYNPNPGNGISDQYNESGNITTIETILAALSFAIGLFAAGSSLAGKLQSKNSTLLIMATGLYFIVFGISFYHTYRRADKLGIMHDYIPAIGSLENTCKDINWQTGCPTTRFKYDLNTSTEDTLEEDSKVELIRLEQCNFNAYNDKENDKVQFDTTPLNGRGRINWADKTFYDNTNKDNLDNVALSINLDCKTDDVCDYGSCIATHPLYASKKCLVKGKDLPDISWCYYWGCSETCNDRYHLNRAWLTISAASTVMYLILLVLSGFGIKSTSDEETSTSLDEVMPTEFKYNRVKRIDF